MSEIKPYAQGTEVSAARSRGEIEDLCQKFGARQFMSGYDDEMLVGHIAFVFNGHGIRFVVKLLPPDNRRFTETRRKNSPYVQTRSDAAAKKAWEAHKREQWRAMALSIKAKFVAVVSGVAMFEEEFMANIVSADGRTLGEAILPQIEEFKGAPTLSLALPSGDYSQPEQNGGNV